MASTSDYGVDTMLDRPKQRQVSDEDAPPVNSVTDIIKEVQPDPYAQKLQSNTSDSVTHRPKLFTASTPAQISYVVVFGFPPDKFDSTVSIFSSLGDCTEPERNHKEGNWFRIGFKNMADASKALRKNGQIVNGAYMIGVIPADSSYSDLTFSTPLRPTSHRVPDTDPSDHSSPSLHRSSVNAAFGKAVTLAPSTSAYKTTPPAAAKRHHQIDSTAILSEASQKSGLQDAEGPGVMSKISDLIFGW